MPYATTVAPDQSAHALCLVRRYTVCYKIVYFLCNKEYGIFLFLICPLYRDLRKLVLPKYYLRWSTIIKFKQLMSTSNKKTLINLAKFTRMAFNLRSSHN